MLQLIVNADDLGLTPGCNSGILQAMTEGIVTDTTLMINTDYTQAAVALLKERGITRAGLHLNLTYGTPLLPAREVPSLVDGRGRFKRKIAEAAPVMRQEEVEREFAAQVEKFFVAGLEMTHLDSHHHAHTFPGIIDAAIALAKRLGVPLRQTGDEVRQKIIAAGVATTDFFSPDFYDQGASAENLQTIIESRSRGTLEIMCHPAVPEELIYAVSSYNTPRERELAILTSREMRDFLREKGVCLVNYDALRF